MRTASILLTAAASVLPFVGCTAVPTISAPDMQWLSSLSGNDEGPPSQLVALWTDASMKKAGSTGATRGFGGRIYFYDAKQHSVKANGELVVYAFVEKDRQVPSGLPERKFIFTAEELEQNYSKTALGHCYDVWLPWSKDADETVSVSLLPMLKTADGNVARGATSLNVLKGKETEGGPEKATVGGGVAQVSYEQDAGSAANGESSRRRMSIYDPQTNVTIGPAAIPAGPLPASGSSAKQVGFQSELPQASGIGTTTFDLPKSMALAIRKAPASSQGKGGLSDRFEAHQAAERNSQAGQTVATNGPTFDLAQAAALDRRSGSKTSKSEAEASTESLARFIAANAGAMPAYDGAAAAKKSDEKSDKKQFSRFSSEPRKTPAWTRNHARWRQED